VADVLLFHHIQGLTPGVEELAERLRAAGHQVTAPDLFEGKTFDSIEAGSAFVEELGFDTVIARGQRVAADLPEGLVYAGISLGVLPAQSLAQTRAGAKGALLYHSCVPASEFGVWPHGVPVQIHSMDEDPFFVGEGDIDAARQLVATVDGAELFLYPGDTHLFADSSLPSYDASAAALLVQRTLDFLDRASA
jgi:dienelactone hydrolase